MSIKNKPLTLTIVEKRKVVKCYFITDMKSLYITRSHLDNSFLISFKSYNRTLLVSTQHFHITGCNYD